MTRDPFRRPPMVDIPADKRESWWRHTTRKLTEAQAWKAETFAELCELSAQFCEGKFTRTPDHAGPRAGETVRIGDELAHANRHGFLTTGSQPGEDEDGHQQRAAVEGWASPETVKRLEGLVAGTRLQMQASDPTWRRADYSNVFEATRQVCEDGSTHVSTEFGFVPSKRTPFIRLGHEELVDGAKYVSIHDPEWGDHSLLWDRLAQPDWDNPAPPQPDVPQLADHDRAVQRYAAAEQAAREQGWPDSDVEEIAWYRQRAERKRERFVRDNPTPPERPAAADSPGPPALPEPETPMSASASRYVPVDDTDDDEVRRVKQAQNAALFARWTAVTDDERRAAREAQQAADDVAAAYEHRQQAARTQPPEPPMGTVLETSDDFVGGYRIERTDDGWRQQYHDGESPDGSRTSPTFGGRGISWRAAWSAWGPPNGAEPFREVPADAPLLPAPPVEPGDDNPLGPDASDGRFGDGSHDMPPPAAPYAPARSSKGHRIRTKWRVDGVRWLGPLPPENTTYQRPAAATTSAQPSGGAMASIEEARGSIMNGHEVLTQVLGGLEQQHASLEEVQRGLLHATEGSNQAEAGQANAQLAEAINKIDEAKQQVALALQEFEGVGQRL